MLSRDKEETMVSRGAWRVPSPYARRARGRRWRPPMREKPPLCCL